ncbi:MAG: acyl-CoA dehydrogenase family protein [Candidatus Binatia bacterium]
MTTNAPTELDSTAILANARALGPEIEAAADAIARERRLPDALIESMRRAGIFRIAFPRAWGGPEMDPLAQCVLMETLAYHDASVAWVAMICSDSGHYAARVDEQTARELYPHLDLLTAGWLAPVGQAHKADGGYRVSGRWQFGSGCLHADRLIGGCMLLEDGAPVFNGGQIPEFRVVWLPRDQVEIHDTWYTTGLAGSGSNDYAVTDVLVPAAHAFHPFQAGQRPEPLYRYHGFFFTNLPAVALGCARRMLDDLCRLALHKVSMPAMQLLKDEYRVQVAVGDATARLGAARAYQNDRLGVLWEALGRGDEPTRDMRAGIALMSVHAIQTAQQVAEIVCEAAGTSAIYASSPFDRRRRDLATIAAHFVGQRRTLQTAGQLLFGADIPTFV